MATNYVSLEEAAKLLGIAPDQLVEMRSQGELRGFKDGASWKFPVDEIERLKDAGLSGIGSGLGLGEESGGSDVALIARQGGGSDVEIIRAGDSDLLGSGSGLGELGLEDGSGLELAIDLKEGSTGPVIGSDALQLAEEGGTGSEIGSFIGRDDSGVDVLSDIDLSSQEKGGTGDIIRGDSDPDLMLGDLNDSDDALSDDDDLVIADDDDDLVLAGGGSDISIAGDSGINLMSPSDSGLSLESEPLDLAGSSISALDLGGDDVLSPSSGGSGSGSLVDFQADEEFQLSPSGVGIDVDDDSGSQVIEVEDSAAFVGDVDFGDGAFGGAEPMAGEAMLEESGVLAEDALVAEEAMMDQGMGIQSGSPAAAMGGVPMAYETPFSVWQVVVLASILILMSLCGMLMTDLMRNLWTYSEPSAPVSSLTDALISMIGFDS
jgi:excisionase family DNA binding protein